MTYFPLKRFWCFDKWWPLNKDTAPMGFGFGLEYPQFIKDKYGFDKHQGIDWTVPEGENVYAYSDGYIGQYSHALYGNWVIIEHGDCTTYYRHLSEFVPHGTWVNAGDIIGKSGNTGLSEGPHLHWEVRKGGLPVDPAPYLQSSITISDYMSNTKLVKVIKKDGSEEIGFYLPAMSPDALKDKAMNLGIEIPTLSDGSVDWPQMKYDYTIKEAL